VKALVYNRLVAIHEGLLNSCELLLCSWDNAVGGVVRMLHELSSLYFQSGLFIKYIIGSILSGNVTGIDVLVCVSSLITLSTSSLPCLDALFLPFPDLQYNVRRDFFLSLSIVVVTIVVFNFIITGKEVVLTRLGLVCNFFTICFFASPLSTMVRTIERDNNHNGTLCYLRVA